MDAITKVPVKIHIFVGKTKVEFETDQVTGLQIKNAAGVSPDSDLARRVHGQLELVTNDQAIEIKEGDHFEVLPQGTIS